MIDAGADPELVSALAVPGYGGVTERAALIRVEAFDWNCPQHITPRFTREEVQAAFAPMSKEIERLRAENRRLALLAGPSSAVTQQ
jgi:predicted pyridoxine 5'-phosphate oxidase superfamily flavin-nucleotide-binding protein